MSVTAITIAVMAVTVNTDYNFLMVRWEPNSQGRLGQAALELYGERGFDQTTVAEIAERAGLTERTFFRHFSDKREVLFAGAKGLQDLFVSTVMGAPAAATPIEAVTLALDAAGRLFDDRRAFSVQRQHIINGSTELQERELIKLATLAGAIADALRQRGVSDPSAGLTGELTIAVFKISFEHWIAPSETRALSQVILESLEQVKALTAAT